jgi:hypothetical protein
VRRCCGIDLHPANRIGRGQLLAVRMNLMLHDRRP